MMKWWQRIYCKWGRGTAVPIIFDLKMTELYPYIHRHKEPRVDFITNTSVVSWLRLPSAMNFKETIWRVQICSCCSSAGAKAVITKATWVQQFLFFSLRISVALPGERNLVESTFSSECLSYVLYPGENIVLRKRGNTSHSKYLIK